jgi:aminodeoxyfutalosine deaminase
VSPVDGSSETVLHTAEVVIGLDGIAPTRDVGIVLNGEGRIIEAGDSSRIRSAYDRSERHQIIMPGVLNCHVHMTDANLETPVGGRTGLVGWVRELLASRRNERADTATILATLERMQQMGTVAIGEVTNDRSTLEAIRLSGIRCRYIHELLAFPAAQATGILERSAADFHDGDRIAVALGLHAPYSVSPELHMLAAEWSREHDRNFFEHLAEDPDERLLYHDGSGPWRALLESLGSWDPAWQIPAASPVEYLDRLGVINERYVAVHLADATAEEISILAGRGARAILSPRSNLHITGLFPPIEEMIRSGLRFALGTDGRGSSPTVDVFDEAAAILDREPALPAGRLLEALTTDAAAILQMPDLGSIAVGNIPGLISVRTDETPDDLGRLERMIILDGVRRRVC